MRMIKTLDELPNVDYRGRVDPETATKVIAESALLLCTSDEEGFPNTFTQAWSSGTPIVSLKVDPGNIIAKLGLGAVSKTAEGAVLDINKLLKSVEQRNDIATRARQYISENHNEATVLDIFNRDLSIPLQKAM
jgi:glycosyltransferase involved in cell wall biosynthesis